MNVLSLFDGISCGQLALQRAGIKVDKYFASEIKNHAIKCTQHHFPETVQLGDVCKVKAADLPKIDLLIGGSPCQNFSSFNQQDRRGLEGEKSRLFFEYLRLLKECRPRFFLLENVVVAKEHLEVINRLLRVEPITINSALVSGQSRRRMYWTNIPGVYEPDDRHITFQSILESGFTPKEKSTCLLVSVHPFRNKLKLYFNSFVAYTDHNMIFDDEETYLLCKDYFEKNFPDVKVRAELPEEYPDYFEKSRQLTTVEMERLQTLPDGYCTSAGLSRA